MSDIKWIKLTVNVFDDEKFDAIRSLPDSNDIQLVWVKLLCLAGTCNENGFLMLTREIPYTDEMLASRFRMDVGVVQRAMMLFQNLNMVEVVDNIYMVSNWLKYQSGDRLEEMKEKHREAQKRYREKQSLLEKHDDGDITSDITSDIIRSYSYSNNNNINNIRHIFKEHIYKYIDYYKEHMSLYNTVEEWMEYKDHKKPKSSNHYDTEKGIIKFLNMVKSHAEDYGVEETIEIINLSISNNYQGVVWQQLERKGKHARSIAEEIATWL